MSRGLLGGGRQRRGSVSSMSLEQPTAGDRHATEREFHDRLAEELRPDRMPPSSSLGALDSAILERAAVGPETKVLEVGCGAGDLTLALVAKGARVSAVDLSPGMVEVARRRVALFAPDAEVDFHSEPAERMSFADGSFDVAVGRFILHHVDLEPAAVELCRVLRPGGGAVFAENWGRNPILNLARRHVAGRVGVPRFGTPDERPLEPADLEPFARVFTEVRCEFPVFEFLRLFDRQILRFRSRSASRLLSRGDSLIHDHIPALRPYSFRVLVTFVR